MHAGTTGRAVDLLLVVGALTLAVGLGAMMEGLILAPDRSDAATPERRPEVVAKVGMSRQASGNAHDEPAGPPPSPYERAEIVATIARFGTSATGHWASPLYPQNGVTLWDKIRVSSPRNRPAFLLGAAIQLHAPRAAATPGPRSGLPARWQPTTVATLGPHPRGAAWRRIDSAVQGRPGAPGGSDADDGCAAPVGPAAAGAIGRLHSLIVTATPGTP